MQINQLIMKRFLFISKSFKREDVRFRLATMLKLTLLTVSPFVLLVCLLGIFYQFNNLYFVSLNIEVNEVLSGIFLDFLYQNISSYLFPIALFLGCLMFISLYIADLMIRPFYTISEYCIKKTEHNINFCYDPLFYADLKLLNNFGDLFFNHMENCQDKGEFMPFKIPRKFQQIHRPVLEQGFFIHFTFWIIITSILTIFFINILSTELHAGVVEYSLHVLKSMTKEQSAFINGQKSIFDMVVWFVMLTYLLSAFTLVSHLYSQVSKPAFAYFSVMRSFLKGNRKSRVHMLGHYFLREHSRNFNKYLDFLCRELKNGYDGK